MRHPKTIGRLLLEDGTVFEGKGFGCLQSTSGEVVFNTGMVGYPEALTDPSYRGQILVLTYPLIGNYGVAGNDPDLSLLNAAFESDRIQISGLIVSEIAFEHNHWNAKRSLAEWLSDHQVPGLTSVDTRALTKHLRDRGSLLGKILIQDEDIELYNPNNVNLVSTVSVSEKTVYPRGAKRVVVVDCGCKQSIIRSLLALDVTVIRVPWDYDFLREEFHGVVISNGPGNPKMCTATIENVRKAIELRCPTLGICLGHQILALAARADTYKMKFGHRSQNQPCKQVKTDRCYITSQNHGFAVDHDSLPGNWEPWFINANDGTNEGIHHRFLPFMGVQFHPEASPGPVDANFLFDEFLARL